MSTQSAHLFIEFIKERAPSSDKPEILREIDFQKKPFLFEEKENNQYLLRGYIVLIFKRLSGVQPNDPRLAQRCPILEPFSYVENEIDSEHHNPLSIPGTIYVSKGFSERILSPYMYKLREKGWTVSKSEIKDNPVVGNIFFIKN